MAEIIYVGFRLVGPHVYGNVFLLPIASEVLLVAATEIEICDLVGISCIENRGVAAQVVGIPVFIDFGIDRTHTPALSEGERFGVVLVAETRVEAYLVALLLRRVPVIGQSRVFNGEHRLFAAVAHPFEVVVGRVFVIFHIGVGPQVAEVLH